VGTRMSTSVDDLLQRAQAAYSAGDLATCHALGTEGLASSPDDARLLALTGRAALDLGDPGAIALLQRLVEVAPDDASAWRDLGSAHLNEGDLDSAERSLREAVSRAPKDRSARLSLGHVAYALGDIDQAAALLGQVAAEDEGDPEPLRNLLEMYRLSGRKREALDAAESLAARNPDDAMALLELGELHLELGDYDAAAEAYQRMRAIDVEQGHSAFAYHALIEVELRRERWRRALDLAIAATAADRHQLTTDLLAYVTAKLFGEADRPAPPRADLDRQLEERRAEHRRMHDEARVAERA
jgi:Flp pilus assembly protein TadD